MLLAPGGNVVWVSDQNTRKAASGAVSPRWACAISSSCRRWGWASTYNREAEGWAPPPAPIRSETGRRRCVPRWQAGHSAWSGGRLCAAQGCAQHRESTPDQAVARRRFREKRACTPRRAVAVRTLRPQTVCRLQRHQRESSPLQLYRRPSRARQCIVPVPRRNPGRQCPERTSDLSSRCWGTRGSTRPRSTPR